MGVPVRRTFPTSHQGSPQRLRLRVQKIRGLDEGLEPDEMLGFLMVEGMWDCVRLEVDRVHKNLNNSLPKCVLMEETIVIRSGYIGISSSDSPCT